MLLPALAKAKQKAYRVQCISNEKQLSLAWIMYAGDNSDVIAPNFSTSFPIPGWIDGKMTWDTADSHYVDNTNKLYLTDPQYALLAPYSSGSAGIYKCPGDIVPCDNGPRVRSYAMNCMMNGAWINPKTQDLAHSNQKPGQTYIVYTKLGTITRPTPSDAWVFIDEHADSIDDGFFWVNLTDNNWRDLPASYHGRSGVLAFADGHADIHKWTDINVVDRPVRKGGYNAQNGVGASPPDDLNWVKLHTSALQ